MIAVLLVAVAAAVALVAPRVLVSASWVYRAPVLGIAAWYAVLFSVTAAVSLGVVSLVIPWPRTVDALCSLWRWCAEALRGEYGFAGHLAGGVLVGVVLLVAARAAVVLARAAWSTRLGRRRYREAVTLLGAHSATLGVTVLHRPEPAAYLVPGRRRRPEMPEPELTLNQRWAEWRRLRHVRQRRRKEKKDRAKGGGKKSKKR